MPSQSAAPSVPTELYGLGVSTHKGAALVRWLAALASALAVALAVSLIEEPPVGLPPILFDLGLVVGITAFVVSAIVLHDRRRRRLTIEQHGNAIRLTVRGTDAALDFPLVCRGAQVTIRHDGVPTYSVHLQLVDRGRRAVTLVAQRGAVHGEQQYWDLPPLERNVVREDGFDVPHPALAGIRARVEALSARAKST